MDIKNRLIEIVKFSGMKQNSIAEKSGLSYSKWRGALHNKDTRINEEIITAVNKLWPQFTYWLITGQTLPDCGQTSPAEEELKLAQKRVNELTKKINKEK